MVKKKIGIIIQARTNSKRFPKKILSEINGYTILEIIIKRLNKNFSKNSIYLSTTSNKEDIKLINIAKKNKINYFIGSENNVLRRFKETAEYYNITDIVRITGDCPLIDSKILKKMINTYKEKELDYLSNNNPPTFPDGLDIEIFKTNLLNLNDDNINNREKEHVTLHIKNNLKNLKSDNFINNLGNYSSLRLTLDYKDDLKLIKFIFKKFKIFDSFYLKEIIDLYKKTPNIFSINNNKIRNSGAFQNKSQALWNRANDLIAGGNMLFSKKPEIFSEEYWPTYYNKAKGINIWDIENKKYIDLCAMGIGTNILGYANEKIDNFVIKNIKNSNSSTLNSTYEYKLAEKILDINRWASKVKFTRTGGEASAVALRLARCLGVPQNVAICGYHGWHDWYLSLNLNKEKKLGSFLFDDVEIGGVSNSLKNTCYSFQYNRFDQLKKLIEEKNIGIIFMEVKRNEEPKSNFLKKIRRICDQKKIILIFDECTSGFRETDCGLHKKYNVNPDILILGKALGNGYAINAILGTEDIMKQANQTFISSTFWSEQIGLTAAFKTIEVMQNQKSWIYISKLGQYLTKNWKKIAKSNNLDISIKGLLSIPNFNLNLKKNFNFRLYITETMIKKKILATNTVYLSTYHNKKVFEKYFDLLNDIFYKIQLYDDDRINIYNENKYKYLDKQIKRFN